MDDGEHDAKITIYQVLAHIKSFELYMTHLGKEFSLECLLSLIEFVEFQKLLLTLIDLEQVDHDEIVDIKGNKYNKEHKLWCELVLLPETLPKSAIVYGDAGGNDRLQNCKIKVHQLYMKYVVVGSDFELNLPGETRARYDRYMREYDKWMRNTRYDKVHKLLLIFDPLMEQMMSLLLDSFRRFRTTEEYKKLKQLVFLH
mmetsp:Transcript_18264/g.29063  ORF Transcript_18264/g.29063 Transcript_18264/m.29063 type:complete len:200 (+) Transcript_18264:3-602(+)